MAILLGFSVFIIKSSSKFTTLNNYNMKKILIAVFVLAPFIGSSQEARKFNKETLLYEGEEKHLSNVKQLTFGGDNAEAYFSFDNNKITYQMRNKSKGQDCDQIYYLNLDGGHATETTSKLISTGKGRTTCSYFLPGDSLILYASTHLGNAECPKDPERRSDGKYVWAIYSDFDIFISDLNGKTRYQLTKTPGYDAEATVSPDGKKIVFTSLRSGDLELYTMDINGKNVKQVTRQLGYDGGAFFSPDSKHLIFRSSRPTTAEEIKEYNDLLKQGLVMPTKMSLYTCDVDGSNLRKITDLPNASWAPFFHPSGNKVIFASNYQATRGLPFNLMMVNLDGSNLEQITYDTMFDAFPMFSYDGKKIIFSSNRNNNGSRDTNLFIADWKD